MGSEWGVGAETHGTVMRSRCAQGAYSVRQDMVGRESGQRAPGQWSQALTHHIGSSLHLIKQGSPIPGQWTSTVPFHALLGSGYTSGGEWQVSK